MLRHTDKCLYITEQTHFCRISERQYFVDFVCEVVASYNIFDVKLIIWDTASRGFKMWQQDNRQED